MDFWIPLMSALAGAVIGSATTVMTVLIQSKSEDAKHRRDLAVKLAMSDHDEAVKHATAHPPATVSPVAIYLAYHLKLLSLASKGELNKSDFAALNTFRDELKSLD